jgi:serine/threonine protein phosphatase PrpC
MLCSTVATYHNNSVHGEDAYLLRPLPHGAFLDAVMDGVTDRRGAEASQAVREALASAVILSPDDVVAVLEEVNQRLYRRGRGHSWLTTVSAALYLDEMLYVVSAGDSPVWRLRPDTMQLLSSSVQGFLYAGIARAIGARPRLGRLHRAQAKLEPGDRLLLATDGVTDHLIKDTLMAAIRSTVAPETAVEHIRALLATPCQGEMLSALLTGGVQPDDSTAIVRFFSGADMRSVPV